MCSAPSATHARTPRRDLPAVRASARAVAHLGRDEGVGVVFGVPACLAEPTTFGMTMAAAAAPAPTMAATTTIPMARRMRRGRRGRSTDGRKGSHMSDVMTRPAGPRFKRSGRIRLENSG